MEQVYNKDAETLAQEIMQHNSSWDNKNIEVADIARDGELIARIASKYGIAELADIDGGVLMDAAAYLKELQKTA